MHTVALAEAARHSALEGDNNGSRQFIERVVPKLLRGSGGEWRAEVFAAVLTDGLPLGFYITGLLDAAARFLRQMQERIGDRDLTAAFFARDDVRVIDKALVR